MENIKILVSLEDYSHLKIYSNKVIRNLDRDLSAKYSKQ